ncbi:bifunctional 3,4-dihydroxy-2-butanone-4-phosphate synthase/GTP cyclohydrolase II [Martelella mediterranea]|uniref:Riboflavin biosynthesis protein RibBA n=1 Tax=Martelella mediterranea DSM 17316 TaxID=1122214 RepID=A0A1U9Z6T3_9HYPH|nr:bifunctional 3,4-dihydroxy-2-butanone-4-phosphate synthase/GTP cyclohydrolase II [Martelella mediterranea]AQZ53423.1 Riboflavin biosynthesis protein RibBA [Martelella mediterranea DSM 17316]
MKMERDFSMEPVERALDAMRAGRMVLLVDDEARENEGDVVVAAEFADAAAVNFMAKHARGLICLTLTGAQVDRLGLTPMVADNRARHTTAFTVSIEAAEGITTGISAAERARTVAAAANPDAKPGDIVSPGHMFPLRAVEGGVLARDGHTEGAVDLARLAGLNPAAVICEVMRDDGEMARRDDLMAFAKEHDMPFLTIADLAEYRMRTEILVDEVAAANLPVAHGAFKVHAFTSRVDGVEHLALVKGPLSASPLVRVHSECLTGDVFGSLRCDCGDQLAESMALIGEKGGVVVYLRGQEGRGIGLANKIRAYGLQEQGLDTHAANLALGLPADARQYYTAAHILKSLGVSRLQLLSNNPAKPEALARCGLTVEKRLPLIIATNPHNETYLAAKREKFGHLLPN